MDNGRPPPMPIARVLHFGCPKTTFIDKQMAISAKLRIQHEDTDPDGDLLREYRCHLCKRWHLGHSEREEVNEQRQRQQANISRLRTAAPASGTSHDERAPALVRHESS